MAADEAPLDAAISAMPGVSCRQEGAFGLAPRQEVPVDWLFSDSSCRPDRSLDLVRRWMKAEAARNFVSTLKFESETVHATAVEFEAIPAACLLHGDQNKHELTFAILRWGRCGTAAALPLYRWWRPLLKRTASPIL